MYVTSHDRSEAIVSATRQELESLAKRGVVAQGNAFSSIVLVKGELNADERAGGSLLAGADGTALRAALERLGYAPEDFCGLAAVAGEAEPGFAAAPQFELLPAEVFREAVEALDPEAVVLLDDVAAHAMREAYADDLAILARLEEAMLAPGVVAHVAGMRVLNLGGFADALSDAREKQVMWARLKLIPPLGEPF